MNFSWRSLYHKLCFEQMLDEFDKLLDFTVFYEYINKLAGSIEVLRVRMLNKEKIKSNHYWIMVILTKLTKLRVLKLQGNHNVHTNVDFFKFLLKGMNYMAKEGRQLDKICVYKLLGFTGSSGDFLYPCLKPNTNLVSLDFKNCHLSIDDAKAIGKVLADFRCIRELDLTSSGLNTTTVKEIADGLMRAKQLEVLKLGENPGMSGQVSSVLYNLAFSPKIRYIDISGLNVSTPDIAEAVYKLIKISGAIETLNMSNTGIAQHLKAEFFQALGENKTLKTLIINNSGTVPALATIQKLGKAIAMNAYRNGALEYLSIVGWMNQFAKVASFIDCMLISKKEHEEMYGDKKLAKEMEKEDLEKSFYFNLKWLNLRSNTFSGAVYNFKNI